MLSAEIYEFALDKGSTLKAAYDLINGVAKARQGSDESLVRVLEAEGVVGKRGRKYLPNDGEAFIRALPIQYSRGRISVSIKDKNSL